MALKKNTANLTRSGTGTGKGKAKACQALPDPEEDANPPEPTHYEPLDLSDDDASPVHTPPPKKESKQARKAHRGGEAEDDYAAFEARHHTQQAPARRRSTVSLPFNHLRLRTWAPQPEELTHCQPAAPRRSGVKARSNSYKYPPKGAPHLVPPPGP